MADPLQSSGASSCPPLNVLQDFVADRLPVAEHREIALHLADCPACRARALAETARTHADPAAVGQPAPARPPPPPLDSVPPPPSGSHASRPRDSQGPGSSSGLLSQTAPPGVTQVPRPGTQVGRYRVERPLGTGGMGVVLLAYDPELNRRVALKLLRAGTTAASKAQMRLVREAQAMARVSHPNVVAVYDVGAWEGQVFVAMEYVEGTTLKSWMKEKRSVRQVLQAFRQAGAGLAAAHQRGIVHRDFKPDNVLIGNDGAVRVMDFGLARAVDSPRPAPDAPEPSGPLDLSITRAGAVMGTPAFMSPEQHLGEPTDARTDQFSFCVTLYKALYGQVPFAGSTLAQLRETVTGGQLRAPPQDPRVPDWLRDAVLRGLSIDPGARFPTMDALLEVLEREPEAEGALPRATGWRARRRGLLLGAVATLSVAALSSTSAWRAFEERAQGQLQAARPRPWNPNVTLVAIDDDAIRSFGWPMSRHLQTRLLEAFAQAGARTVGYDIFFTLKAPDGEEADALFGQALASYGKAVVVGLCTPEAEEAPAGFAEQLARSSVAVFPPGTECENLVPPREPILRGASLAQPNVPQSASGNARGITPLAEVAGRGLPTLGLAMYLAGQGRTVSELAVRSGAIAAGGMEIPVDRKGAALVSFRERPFVLPFGTLVEALSKEEEGAPTFSKEAAEALRGRYVLIGLTADRMKDLGAFANGEVLPMVLLHAAFLSDLLEGRLVREPPPWARLLLVVLVGALLTFTALLLRPMMAAAGLAVFLVGFLGCALQLAQAGLVIAPLGPAAAAILSFAFVFAGRAAAEERERRRVRSAFHAYVNAAALARILRDPGAALPLEGARKSASVLCASVEALRPGGAPPAPEQELAQLRGWLKALAERVLAEDGRVEVLRADGLLAVFGDPIPRGDHARRAVAAALGMQQALGGDGVALRIGVATGPVLVGNVGLDEDRIDYALHGKPVKEASRLMESAGSGDVLVSEEVREGCRGGFDFERAQGSGGGGPYRVRALD